MTGIECICIRKKYVGRYSEHIWAKRPKWGNHMHGVGLYVMRADNLADKVRV